MKASCLDLHKNLSCHSEIHKSKNLKINHKTSQNLKFSKNMKKISNDNKENSSALANQVTEQRTYRKNSESSSFLSIDRDDIEKAISHGAIIGSKNDQNIPTNASFPGEVLVFNDEDNYNMSINMDDFSQKSFYIGNSLSSSQLGINYYPGVSQFSIYEPYKGIYSNKLFNSTYDLHTCLTNVNLLNSGIERDKENIDILEVNLKLNNKLYLLKLKRYDDLFKTVTIFCEFNKIDQKFIKSIIIYIIRCLNSIYSIYNLNLKQEEIQFLKHLKKEYSQEHEEMNIENKDSSDNDEPDEPDDEDFNFYGEDDKYN